MTDQRRVIARVLSDAADHPDAEELYRRASAIDPHISIATVYRTVKLFEDAGILERHDFRDGRSRYEEVPDAHHDHLIDVQSGRVIEFRNEEIERLQRRVAEELGFELVDHRPGALRGSKEEIVGADVRSLRAASILFVFVVLTVAGIPWQMSAQRFHLKRRKTFPHRYHRILCWLFGIRLTVIGQPVQGRGVLMVSNHTSYFDILALSAAACVSFIAKSQVASWPFFGLLAKLQGTVFIDRERRSSAGEARDLIRRAA